MRARAPLFGSFRVAGRGPSDFQVGRGKESLGSGLNQSSARHRGSCLPPRCSCRPCEPVWHCASGVFQSLSAALFRGPASINKKAESWRCKSRNDEHEDCRFSPPGPTRAPLTIQCDCPAADRTTFTLVKVEVRHSAARTGYQHAKSVEMRATGSIPLSQCGDPPQSPRSPRSPPEARGAPRTPA